MGKNIMNILICGAQGFIGRHLCQHLQAAGHKIIQAQRRHPSSTQAQDIKEANSNHDNEVVIDFAQDVSDEQWRKRLQTIIAMHGTLDRDQCSRHFARDLRANFSQIRQIT